MSSVPHKAQQVSHISRSTDMGPLLVDSKKLIQQLNFHDPQLLKILSVISELATNILKYGIRGTIALEPGPDSASIRITAQDSGPGIADIERATRDGFSSSGTLGFGLPGVQRMSDEFTITSSSKGTKVVSTIRKQSSHVSR